MGLKYPREVILAYIEKYITTDWSENQEWINVDSIFTSDNKKRLGFNVEKGFVNDFKMGQNWTLESFIAEHQDVPEAAARTILMRMMIELKKSGVIKSIKLTEEKHVREEAVELDRMQKHQVPPFTSFNDMGSILRRRAIKFLEKRKISEKHIKKFRLTFVDQQHCWNCDGEDEDCPVCKGQGYNPYYGRIIIPTYENENLVFFQARDFMGKELRYRNPEMQKKYVVPFYDQLESESRIVVVEGPFDAMTLVDENVTCMMGPNLSIPQALKIFQKKPKEIIFAPDYDDKPETRQRIQSAMRKNIEKIMTLSNNTVPVYTYEWYRIPEVKQRLLDQMKFGDRYDKSEIKKDLNDFNISTIQETYLKNVSDKFSMIKEKLGAIK